MAYSAPWKITHRKKINNLYVGLAGDFQHFFLECQFLEKKDKKPCTSYHGMTCMHAYMYNAVPIGDSTH